MAELSKGAKSSFDNVGTKIEILRGDDFLKIKETLTRVGIVTEPNKLMQVCYILHKKGQYSIVHYKELLLLDGIKVEVDDIDVQRRQIISLLLEEWNLLKLISDVSEKPQQLMGIKVVPYKERDKWTLFSLYNIGRK